MQSEATVRDFQLHRHPYNVIAFDFEKAFDKAPHPCIIRAVQSIGFSGPALKWLESFLTGRTFRVRIGDTLSDAALVSSGVIQGYTLGSILYNIFIDSLLSRITLPSEGFADDFKLLADVSVYTAHQIQDEIDKVVTWTDENYTPLSVDKCVVLHCDPRQSNNVYHIRDIVINSVDNLCDLGISRSSDGSFSDHCLAIANEASQVCGIIRHTFRSRHRNLLWPAFIYYVLPILSYCSLVWNQFLQRDIVLFERIQRSFTKRIRGHECMT